MTRLHIPDMTCKHCVATITQLIQNADEDAQLTIDLPSHQVDVQGKLEQSRLLSLLEDAGYTPEVI